MTKKIVVIPFFLLISSISFGQLRHQLSLEDAYKLLEENYAVLQNAAIQDQIYQKELEALNIARMPSIQLKADGRLQSESISIPTEGGMPSPIDVEIPIYSLASYLEGRYLIMDGGVNEAQRKLKAVELKAKQQNIEVTRFSLRERINTLFVNIDLLREQNKLFDLSLKDLAARKEQVTAGVTYGTILESELTKLEVRELELRAQRDNIAFQLRGLINSLGQLIGETLPENLVLEFPVLPAPTEIPTLNRPEQTLFQVRRDAIMAQSDLIETERKPKLSAFAQAGVGYPNQLNFFDTEVSPYGIIGLNFSWKIVDWKKEELSKELLTLQTLQLQNEQATFEFNLESQTANYLATIDRLERQIEHDEQVAQLQADILQQLAAQLDEGVITSSDYIIQLNAELMARQNLSIHQTELRKTQLEFWNQRGS
jgi:outer membrane protein TolC